MRLMVGRDRTEILVDDFLPMIDSVTSVRARYTMITGLARSLYLRAIAMYLHFAWWQLCFSVIQFLTTHLF